MGTRTVADTGGIDAASYGAGWASAAALFAAAGAWIRRILIKAKDDQIATLIAAKNEQIATLVSRIEHLERHLDDQRKAFERAQIEERTRCDRQIDALNIRITQLEAMTVGAVRRGDVQSVISEIRTERGE